MTRKKTEVIWVNEEENGVESDISWDIKDPLVVSISFHGGSTWFISRDLLSDALSDEEGRWHGEGDVRTRSALYGSLQLTLETPSGRAELETESGPLQRFLALTYREAPRDQEDLGIDQGLNRLMGR